jgi:hypothetical protein
MEEVQAKEETKVVFKPFMTAGPTLHYSHQTVVRCWLLSLGVFCLCCFFWSKITTGQFWSFEGAGIFELLRWQLGSYVISGVSIFEYPWQILVVGGLMGVIAVVPVLVSQLMSFIYSVPFVLAICFFANLPGFAVFVFVSCAATAVRPLRFRSRFVAIALCMMPQLLYWGYFGGAKGVEPLRYGYSYTPWIFAWLTSLGVAGIVLSIGHFTRYKPGLVWSVTLGIFLVSVAVFDSAIGFDELDYQSYVAKNNPELIEEFHDHSITEALDETITNPGVKKYLLAGYFYPTEPIQQRAELKRKIQTQLRNDRWPSWFLLRPVLNYQDKKRQLFEQYDIFINRRPTSRRMPIALYYKGLLSEYSVDTGILGAKEVLHFYSDYPFERSREIWYRLYSEFSGSAESIEARWRIARHWAGVGRFEMADGLLGEAQDMVREKLKLTEQENGPTGTFFSPFKAPAETVMTTFKLTELQKRLNHLRTLIGKGNRTPEEQSEKLLAKFVMLNGHDEQFRRQLDELLSELTENSPLRDNILLEKVKLTADEKLRAEELEKLYKQFSGTDGGMQALYELALLKISFWRKQDEADVELKKKYLADARSTLTTYINLYPDSFCAEQVKKNLDNLPAIE